MIIDQALSAVYGREAEAMEPRYADVGETFTEVFGKSPAAYFRAPGRVELGGNHTDHQHGKVLAASVTLDIAAAAAPRNDGKICLFSKGYRPTTVDMTDLRPRYKEKGTTRALMRGVASAFDSLGADLSHGGFDICASSLVPSGSGLSSSAAFEILMGCVFNRFCIREPLDPITLAQIGQYAENSYFGKPSGLMDQLASSLGGVVSVDLLDPKRPAAESLYFDPEEHGYTMAVLNCGAGHENLTSEYAAITAECRAVSRYFGKSVLREVPEEEFYADINAVRRAAGDRAVLRACHFYAESARAEAEAEAIRRGDTEAFLELVRASGRSSAEYLQNVIPAGKTGNQEMMVALCLAERWLGGKGAVRVHGGGFGGTVLAFVPSDRFDSFFAKASEVFGEKACCRVRISPLGGTEL